FLIPKKGTDMTRWSVVACDQFTSEPEYWERVRAFTLGHPTTLDIVLPEAYLEAGVSDGHIQKIHDTMDKYQKEVLEEKKGFVLVERMLRDGSTRKGLMICIDLEAYDYTPF